MEALNLSANRNWRFYRGAPPKGRAVNAKNPHDSGLMPFDVRYNDCEWEVVHLPHTVRVEKLLCSGGMNYQGECWYRKKFTVKREWCDKETFFEFDGVMQRVDAWLDGKPLGYALGGFLPVRFDVSGISAGEHLLVLRADNSDLPDVPPAKPQGALDFCYFGGIYRNARFLVKNKVRFTSAVHEGRPAAGGLFIRTFPEDKSAEVRVRASVLNHESADAEIRLELLLNGEKVFESEVTIPVMEERDFDGSFVVREPRLWSPDNPALYTLTARLLRGEEVLDERTERFGIRKAEFRADGFYLNGKRLYLNGSNRHQEYPYIGFALPDSLQRRDARLLREAGIVCIRTAHYPVDEVFMNACDELGILCIIPTPGWQIHPSSVLFDERSYENTRRMIRLHRNHASALMWEPILNETDYPEYFAEKQLQTVREECGDTTAFASCDSCSRGAADFPVNYRYGSVDEEKTLFIREYGDAYMEQYGPMGTMRRVRRGEHTDYYPGGERAMIRNARERLEVYEKNRKNERISGAALWCGFDNNRGYELNEGAWGMLDFLRIPKFFYHAMEAQQEIAKVGAKCFIANYRTENSPTDVTVYSNAEEVRLILNGKEIAKRKVERSEGVNRPVVFQGVPYEKGVLLAEAIENGRVVKTHEVRTPEAPFAVRLNPHYAGEERWKADGSDLLLVHAEIVDGNGTVVPTAEPYVTFRTEGDAEIVGKREAWVKADVVQAEAGITGVLLRAGTCGGAVKLYAEAEGLKPAEITLFPEKDDTQYLAGEEYRNPEILPEYPCDAKEFFSVRESIKDTQSHNWDIGVLKEAAASSCAEGFGADNANRKEMGQPWIAGSIDLPQWWRCDLAGEFTVNGVAVSWEKDWLWYDYRIETSLNGVDWECRFRGNASGQTRLPDRFPLPARARFVRIVIQSISGKEPAGIYHVEIFGNRPKQ